jgi:CheY-like chemotaxis protein
LARNSVNKQILFIETIAILGIAASLKKETSMAASILPALLRPNFSHFFGSRENSKAQKPDENVRRLSILVVDDEPRIAETLREILVDSGYEAVAFSDSRKASKYLVEHCPDVLLSDVVMPYLDGIKLASLANERCPQTRVLLLSGHAATSPLMQDARARGYNFELLAKPLEPEVLLHWLAG